MIMRAVIAAFVAIVGLPIASPASAASGDILYSFRALPDAQFPSAPLIQDSKGVLYGTTGGGGSGDQGAVFSLSPPVAGATGWTEKVIYSFKGGSDGFEPLSSLVLGADGVLYGTTYWGGGNKACLYGCGTIFKLTPPAAGKTEWTETVLHRFGLAGDGVWPVNGGLVMGANGVLYGTTSSGGATGFAGTVFRLTPPFAGETVWAETILWSFKGGTDGSSPQAGLVIGANGDLYGTTNVGGSSSDGTVFRLTPPATGKGAWSERVLYSFKGATDGQNPIGTLLLKGGVLYGTTQRGGADSAGTIFALAPPTGGKTVWVESVLHSFSAKSDGAYPPGGLIADSSGALYGTIAADGKGLCGAVFELKPPASGTKLWHETILHNFQATGGDGEYPGAGLLLGAHDVLYGTTSAGGTVGRGYGTVFSVDL